MLYALLYMYGFLYTPLYTLFIVAHMHGHLAVATHDFKSMQTCLAVKKEMVTLLKDYDARIVCEPKLGEI